MTKKDGSIVYEEIDYEKIIPANSIFILPKTSNLIIDTKTEQRKRGIFQVPVYKAKATQNLSFDPSEASKHLSSNETALWQDARLIIGMERNKSLRGDMSLIVDGKPVKLEPRANKAGLVSYVGDPRKMKHASLKLDFLGAQHLSTTAIARSNTVTFTSDWPHPSFTGAFLPDSHDINHQGFRAEWKIPHLARPVPQISRSIQEDDLRNTAQFGVKFYQPNDFYHKAYRAGRYGILFIALTFLTILVLDKNKTRTVHPVQYLMVGLVQSLFVLLMVSFAEHIGFNAAYAVASTSTIGLITLYAFVGLKMGKASWLIGIALLVLYGVLYLILGSADYALLAGSLLCFAAIASLMLATRNEDWHGKVAKLKPVFPSKKPAKETTE